MRTYRKKRKLRKSGKSSRRTRKQYGGFNGNEAHYIVSAHADTDEIPRCLRNPNDSIPGFYVQEKDRRTIHTYTDYGVELDWDLAVELQEWLQGGGNGRRPGRIHYTDRTIFNTNIYVKNEDNDWAGLWDVTYGPGMINRFEAWTWPNSSRDAEWHLNDALDTIHTHYLEHYGPRMRDHKPSYHVHVLTCL